MLRLRFIRTTASNWLFWLGWVFILASCGFTPKSVATYENEFFILHNLVRVEDGFYVYQGTCWNNAHPTPEKQELRIGYSLVSMTPRDTNQKYQHFERLILLNDSTYLYGESWKDYWIGKGRWTYSPANKLLHFFEPTEYIAPNDCSFFQDIAHTFSIKENLNAEQMKHLRMPQHLKNALNLKNLKLLGEMDIHIGNYTFDLPSNTKTIEFAYPARNLQRTFSVWE